MKGYINKSIIPLLLAISGCASTHDPLAGVLGPVPNEGICKYFKPTGSRITQRHCMTQEGWDAAEKEAEAIMKEAFESRTVGSSG